MAKLADRDRPPNQSPPAHSRPNSNNSPRPSRGTPPPSPPCRLNEGRVPLVRVPGDNCVFPGTGTRGASPSSADRLSPPAPPALKSRQAALFDIVNSHRKPGPLCVRVAASPGGGFCHGRRSRLFRGFIRISHRPSRPPHPPGACPGPAKGRIRGAPSPHGRRGRSRRAA